MMFHALNRGVGGLLTDSCYYACSLTNPNNLAMCAQGCCAENPDASDALCTVNPTTGAPIRLPQSPAEQSTGIGTDILDTITGSYPGGSNAAAAATCANNPTFSCWLQQNGTVLLYAAVGIVGVFAVAELAKAAK